MPPHNATVVVMNNCLVCNNYGTYNNSGFTLTCPFISETTIYTRNYTLVTTELVETTGLQHRPLSSSSKRPVLCFVFCFPCPAPPHARKMVCTSSVFYAEPTTTTTATKNVRCGNKHKHQHQHIDDHQSSHHLTINNNDDRNDRNKCNDNNPPQGFIGLVRWGSQVCGHCS